MLLSRGLARISAGSPDEAVEAHRFSRGSSHLETDNPLDCDPDFYIEIPEEYTHVQLTWNLDEWIPVPELSEPR